MPALGVLFNPGGRVLSREVHSVAYRHARDGKNYRHDFEGAVTARLNQNGSVTLRHNQDKPIWKAFADQDYFVNPKEKGRKMPRRTKGGRRAPPKGFGSWKAYMASIRPGSSKRKRRKSRSTVHANPTKGGTMHRKKKGSKRRGRRGNRSVALVRSAAPKGVRRRHRRNPPGMFSGKGLMAFGLGVVTDAGILVGTRAATRVWPLAVNIDTGTPKGRTFQALAAILAGGVAHAMGHSDLGAKIAAAGISVPAEAMLHDMVKDNANPMIASAFGDDRVFLAAYPGVNGYPNDVAMRAVPAASSLSAYPRAGGLNGYPATSQQQYQS